MHTYLRAAVLTALVVPAGCRTGRDYPSVDGPRYAGAPPAAPAERRAQAETLRIVSFNIEFARRTDGAIALHIGVLRRGEPAP